MTRLVIGGVGDTIYFYQSATVDSSGTTIIGENPKSYSVSSNADGNYNTYISAATYPYVFGRYNKNEIYRV